MKVFKSLQWYCYDGAVCTYIICNDIMIRKLFSNKAFKKNEFNFSRMINMLSLMADDIILAVVWYFELTIKNVSWK